MNPIRCRTACLAIVAALIALSTGIARAQTPTTEPSSPRDISVDCAQALGPRSYVYNFSVGSDRAIIHLRPSDQRDLQFVHDQIGFRYIRFHGLLNEEMKTYSESPAGQPIYNWSNVDAVYDFLLHIGMKPFVELGFIPTKLASGKETIFYWKGNTTPPRDYAQWGKFIQALVQHLTDRYGADEVKRWYFEVWNEPNLSGFWHGSQADYFRLYTTTAEAVKSVNPGYRVGGPATAGGGWLDDFCSYCATSHSPVDFVSTHAYGVSQGFLDAHGNKQLVLDAAPFALAGQLPGMLARIRSSPLPNLPLYLTEWSTSYSPRDPVHDSYVSAAYILQTLRNVPAGVDGMSYWTFSDQFEEAGPPPSPFHGGFGLLNTQGLPKPAFFAYRFLNQLGNTELQCNDKDAWAARDNDGRSVSVLFWNFTSLHQDAPNQKFFTRDLTAAPAGQAHVAFDHLPAGEYTAKIFRVGYRHNDVYTAYVDLGLPKGIAGHRAILPDSIANQLRAHCTGKPESVQAVHVSGNAPSWSVDLPMNQNDVYLVQMIRS